MADWWAFGEHKYGDRKKIVESEEWIGPSLQACADAGRFAEILKLRDVTNFYRSIIIAKLRT